MAKTSKTLTADQLTVKHNQNAALKVEAERIATLAADRAASHAMFLDALAQSAKGRVEGVSTQQIINDLLLIELDGIAGDAAKLTAWKRDVKAHVIAAYMSHDLEATRVIITPKAAGGKLTQKEWGKAFAPDGCNDLLPYQTKADKADAWARRVLTDAFKAHGLDIETGLAKPEPAAAPDTVKAGQGATSEPAAAPPVDVAATLKVAPAADIVAAIVALPINETASIFADAALLLFSKGGLSMADRHFVEAIMKAAGYRRDEIATPATACGGPVPATVN